MAKGVELVWEGVNLLGGYANYVISPDLPGYKKEGTQKRIHKKEGTRKRVHERGYIRKRVIVTGSRLVRVLKGQYSQPCR